MKLKSRDNPLGHLDAFDKEPSAIIKCLPPLAALFVVGAEKILVAFIGQTELFSSKGAKFCFITVKRVSYLTNLNAQMMTIIVQII